VGNLWTLVTVSLAMQKLLSVMQSYLFILSFRCWAIVVLFRKLFPMTMCSRIFPTPCFNCFKVSGLILRYLIHIELILVQGERQWSSFSHGDIQLSSNICWKGWTILASLKWNWHGHGICFLMCCWIWFASIWLRIFESIFISNISFYSLFLLHLYWVLEWV
jgi:hypothetical protein